MDTTPKPAIGVPLAPQPQQQPQERTGVLTMQHPFPAHMALDLQFRAAVKARLVADTGQILAQILSDGREYVVQMKAPRVVMGEGDMRWMICQALVLLVGLLDAEMGEHVYMTPDAHRQVPLHSVQKAADAEGVERWFVHDPLGWCRVSKTFVKEHLAAVPGMDADDEATDAPKEVS